MLKLEGLCAGGVLAAAHSLNLFSFGSNRLAPFGRIVDLCHQAEFMGVTVCGSGASVCEVNMSAVAGWDGERRLAAEFMLEVIMGVCAEGDVVEMAVSCRNCLAGHGGEAVVMASLTGFCKNGTSDKLVHMLSFAGVKIGGIGIKAANGRYLSFSG